MVFNEFWDSCSWFVESVFARFSEKVQTWTHAKPIVNYCVSLRLRKTKNMKVSYKTSKKQLQNSLQLNNGVWDRLLLQNGPWGSPRQLPDPPQAAPGAQKGSLCDSCLAPSGPPCESLAAPWHCLGASKTYFGSLGTPSVWSQCILGPRFRLKIGDLSIISLIYHPFLPWLCFSIRFCFHGFPCY